MARSTVPGRHERLEWPVSDHSIDGSYEPIVAYLLIVESLFDSACPDLQR
jgi:hypothetical protein